MSSVSLLIFAVLAAPLTGWAANDANPAPAPTEAKVKYKKGDDLNFEKLLVQGEYQRPNLTVVTGNVQKGGDGLLRLRKDFVDRISSDFGEEVK